MIILISFLSCILDNTVNYYLPFLPSFFQCFKPMFFVSSILFFIVLFLNDKKILFKVFVISLFYDFLFGNIYFLHFVIISLLFLFIYFIKKMINSSLIIDIILLVTGLVLFFVFKFMILCWIDYSICSFKFLFDEIFNSLVLNIVYIITLYYFLGIKYKKI